MIRFLNRLFTGLYDTIYGGIKVTIYFKSGNKFSFRCKKCNFSYKGNEVTGYSIEKHNKDSLWFDTKEIEAIIIH